MVGEGEHTICVMGKLPSRNKGQLVLASLILFVLKCVSNTQAEVNKAFSNPFTLNDIDTEMEALTDGQNPLYSQENLDKASNVLAKLLLIPWPKGGSPLLYVENPGTSHRNLENSPYRTLHTNNYNIEDVARPISSKRSKYYRKYPWKRQQTNMRLSGGLANHNDIEYTEIDSDSLRPQIPKRSKYYRKCQGKRHNNWRYEPAYMCLPNKDDVYRLLVAIHGERDGYKGQLVDFCNRKRPASLVFTNIRYVG